MVGESGSSVKKNCKAMGQRRSHKVSTVPHFRYHRGSMSVVALVQSSVDDKQDETIEGRAWRNP